MSKKLRDIIEECNLKIEEFCIQNGIDDSIQWDHKFAIKENTSATIFIKVKQDNINE